MSASAQRKLQTEELAELGGLQEGSVVQRRVLLIDEQAHVLRVMRLNLDRQGYEVDTAQSSKHALVLLRKLRYDALIITSDMPDMSTRQLCQSATRDGQNAVRIILVSHVFDDWAEQFCIVEQLDKPVSLRRIVSRLSEEFGDDSR